MPDRATFGATLAMALSLTGGGCRAQTVPPPGDQLSADCAAPVYATDQLVCSEPGLVALDAHMRRLWHIVEARHPGNGDLRHAQAAWFRDRSLCAFKPDHRACVVAAYRSCIAALLRLAGTK